MCHIEADVSRTISYLRTPKYASIKHTIMVDISIVAIIIAELPRNIKIEDIVTFIIHEEKYENSNTLRSIGKFYLKL